MYFVHYILVTCTLVTGIYMYTELHACTTQHMHIKYSSQAPSTHQNQ